MSQLKKNHFDFVWKIHARDTSVGREGVRDGVQESRGDHMNWTRAVAMDGKGQVDSGCLLGIKRRRKRRLVRIAPRYGD